MWTVSYTHLDVYKRQSMNRQRTASAAHSLVWWVARTTWQPSSTSPTTTSPRGLSLIHILKEAIINNSDVVMLLDQSKFRERFDEIKAILGWTDVDCKKIFTVNRLDNKEGRSFFREVFIRRGSTLSLIHILYLRYSFATSPIRRAIVMGHF